MRENLNKTPFKKIIGLISCIPKKSLLLFVAGSFGIAFLFCMSRVSWRVNWYSTPDFSFSFLIRTFMIALSVLAILYSVKTGNLSRKIEFTSEQKIALHAILTLTVVGFFLLALAMTFNRWFMCCHRGAVYIDFWPPCQERLCIFRRFFVWLMG